MLERCEQDEYLTYCGLPPELRSVHWSELSLFFPGTPPSAVFIARQRFNAIHSRRYVH